MKKFLYEKYYRKSILDTQTKERISETQLPMEDNSVQHTGWYNTIHVQTQFQILVKLLKWYIQIFFGENGGRNPHHSDSEN